MSRTFEKNPFQGGAGLATGELAAYLDEFVDKMTHCQDGIIDGGIVTTNTKTQGSGTSGATTISINVANLNVFVDGVYKAETGGSGLAVHATTCLLQLGESVYVWVVEKDDGGTLSLDAVEGTPDVDGSEEIPTFSQVQAALGEGVGFVKVALLHYYRGADTTLTEVIDMTYRQPHGVAFAKDY